MYFDIPKVFRSPGCDHGHVEESRNGRDKKIDILDDYIRTPEVFRVISQKTGVPEGLPEPPGEVLGLSGPEGREEEATKVGVPPPSPIRIGVGVGPPFLLPPHFFPLLVGVLLLLGGGLPPPWRASRAGRPPPLLLYIHGQGGNL